MVELIRSFFLRFLEGYWFWRHSRELRVSCSVGGGLEV